MPGSGFPAACTRKRGGREQDPGRRASRRPKGPDRPMYAMTDRREHKQEEPVRENPTVKPLSETDSKREPKSDAGSNPQAAPKPAASRFPTAGDLLAMLGIALAAQILIGIVGQLLAAGFGIDFQTAAPNIQGRMMAVLYFISMSVALGGVLYYRHVRGGRGRWARFSLRGLNPTLLLWCFILIFAVGIVLEPLLQVMPELQLQVGRGFWTLLSLVVFAPIFEELLCRGVVLGSLRDRYGVTAAWLVSALFFGLLHVQPVQVINATAVGLILGYVYLATESMWSVMILHALNNAAAYLLMILVVTPESGHQSALLINLINSPGLYWCIYAVAVGLCAVSGWMMLRTLRRMKEPGKNPARA